MVTFREDLAVASLLGGLCLANAKLGVVHGFAGVLGGMYANAPHGAICATLLPVAFQKNAEKLSNLYTSTGDESALIKLNRFVDVSRIVTGNSNASWQDGVTWLNALVNDLQVPKLTQLCEGMKIDDIDVIVDATSTASSTKGNPISLTNEELIDILRQSM